MSTAHHTPKSNDNASDELIPFLWIRRGIGVLGILFPFLMYIGNGLLHGCWSVFPSISAYYHSHLITVFISTLAMIAIFLFTYRGPHGEDRHIATLAAVLCLGVAIFPTAWSGEVDCPHFVTYSLETLHMVCAVGLFLILAYFCLFIFVKTKPGKNPSERMKALKEKRNMIYKSCGIVMVTTMILMGICYLVDTFDVFDISIAYIFWGETVCLIAFGFSWITKGNWFIYGDGTEE